MSAIPESEWIWCGYAGHFICSEACHMHLHTRVGDYRISTVGDYHPPDFADPRCAPTKKMKDIGYGRKFETFVFRVSGEGLHGEGKVSEWSEIDAEGYNEMVDAERGHMAMCRKYAGIDGGRRAAASPSRLLWQSTHRGRMIVSIRSAPTGGT